MAKGIGDTRYLVGIGDTRVPSQMKTTTQRIQVARLPAIPSIGLRPAEDNYAAQMTALTFIERVLIL